jgi:uncharacterized protein YjdB
MKEMVRNNNIAGKAIAAAVCVAMVFSVVFAFPPIQAAAATAPKTITVDGVGNVQYSVLSGSDSVHNETGIWYHNDSIIGGKDFRLMSNGKNIVYLAQGYEGLPGRDSGNNIIEDTDPLNFTLYGTSKMSYLDFWKGEGLTPKTLTDASSNVKDPEGYYDLGGFDTVVRASLSFGIGHTAYGYENILYGYEARDTGEVDDSGEPIYEYAEDANGDPIPAGPFAPKFEATGFASTGYRTVGAPGFGKGAQRGTSLSGHASSEDFFIYPDPDDLSSVEVYKLDTYNVAGFANMPVSVKARDYIENMILADMGEEIPNAFTNFNEGGKLANIWDDADTTGATFKDVTVGPNTGLVKLIDKDGNYGKAAPGKSEMTTYTYGPGAVTDDWDSSWGDYYDALLPLKADPVDSALTQKQYNNFVYNLIGAKYEYYGDVKDIPGIDDKDDITDLTVLEEKSDVKAAYGTLQGADWWWRPASKNPRLELGFNFDSIRLGGNGKDTANGGVYQQGSASDKAGFYKITLYALGHANIEKLVYVPERYIRVSEDALSMNKGSSQTLAVESKNHITLAADDVETVTWKSSNTKVATVDASGKVTGLAAGTATITAEYKATRMQIPRGGTEPVETVVGEFAPICKVTIVDPLGGGTPGGETPSGNTPVGDTPGGETPGGETPSGNTPSGDTPIYTSPVSDNTVVAASIKLNVSKATLYHKGSKSKTTLKATVTGASNAVTWKSSNTKVATVSSTGVVTAKAKGTATITATANGINAATIVTVKNAVLKLKKASATIKKGKKYTIKAAATPTAKATYKSSNKKVATVSSKGVVKAKKKGKATITVTANGISKKFKITIK